jgi:hypothetical protein
MGFVQTFKKIKKKHCVIAFESFTKYKKVFNLLGRKGLGLDFCCIAKKLELKIMHQHYTYLSVRFVAIQASVKNV